jgi:uncharacterized protein (TIGR01741 family)
MDNFTISTDKILKNIMNHVNEMIPEEWNKVYIYGEVTEGAGVVSFYYNTEENDEYISSANLTELFNINEEEFTNEEYRLLKLFEQLQQEFINNNQEPWTNLTICLESTGKFHIDYDYTDLSDGNDYKRQVIWEYKYLDIEPEDRDDKKIIKDYLNSIDYTK